MSRVGASSPRSGRRPFVSLRPGSRFSEVYDTGVFRRVGGIVVVCALGRGDEPEVGVVAGRRVGNAVQRNRAKRRLREAVVEVPLQPNTAYVVIASTRVLEVPFATLVDWLSRVVGGELGVGGDLEEEEER